MELSDHRPHRPDDSKIAWYGVGLLYYFGAWFAFCLHGTYAAYGPLKAVAISTVATLAFGWMFAIVLAPLLLGVAVATKALHRLLMVGLSVTRPPERTGHGA